MGPALNVWGHTVFLGRSAHTQGGSTPHKQTPPPKQGYVPPREDRPHPRRVVTGLKNLHANVNYYFYSLSTFVEYLGIKTVPKLS